MTKMMAMAMVVGTSLLSFCLAAPVVEQQEEEPVTVGSLTFIRRPLEQNSSTRTISSTYLYPRPRLEQFLNPNLNPLIHLNGHNSLSYNNVGNNPLSYNPLSYNPLSYNPLSYNPLSYNPFNYNPNGYNPLGNNPYGYSPYGSQYFNSQFGGPQVYTHYPYLSGPQLPPTLINLSNMS